MRATHLHPPSPHVQGCAYMRGCLERLNNRKATPERSVAATLSWRGVGGRVNANAYSLPFDYLVHLLIE